ncbi:uncharacterized protein si:dkey-211g8.5 [Danio rerio]|uniref:Si:dkey-211g8.5 n=1 Tax=Danio rerio TaxID=7955 RepID=F1R2X7_DANRE|nr:uncharacterized protein si:dkey-211g8.5 [Danio rerio]|eukprot:XP_003200591.2 uncharacterized protein si:dkey-211g8.5 [Danio rerio]
MNRHSKRRYFPKAEKMQPRRGKKSFIRDERKSKACRTTESVTPSGLPEEHLDMNTTYEIQCSSKDGHKRRRSAESKAMGLFFIRFSSV